MGSKPERSVFSKPRRDHTEVSKRLGLGLGPIRAYTHGLHKRGTPGRPLLNYRLSLTAMKEYSESVKDSKLIDAINIVMV